MSKPQQKTATTKMLWPDAIRVIAIFLVILIHTSATIVLSWEKVSTSQWMIANIFDSLGRISVPLFIILSGSLLIHKKDNLVIFLKKRVSRILLPWIFWGTILLFFNNFFGFARFGEKSIKVLLVENFLGGFWFMPMIAGIYMIAPIIKKFAKKANNNELGYFFIIWLILSSLISNPNLPTWFLYLGYFVGGYCIIYKLKITKNLVKMAKMIFSIGLIITILGTYWLTLKYNEFNGYLYKYTSLNVLSMSFSSFIILFDFFKKNDLRKKFVKPLQILSKNSFGIFLSHIMILKILESGIFLIRLDILDFQPLISIPILTIVVFLISNYLIFSLKKIKLLKEVVG